MNAPRPTPSTGNRVLILLATGFGSGYAPKAPGTAGSVVGILIAWPLMGLPLWGFVLATLAIFALGVVASNVAEAHFSRKDPGAIVIDEIAGIMVTLIGVSPTPMHLLLGFALFRLFDISKPPPCRWSERRFKGGLGVMMDDIFAGVYAAICLQLLIHYTGL
jgi:phosphatidylglycerophosphatase A